jgi:flagellar hook-length control protein FliK
MVGMIEQTHGAGLSGIAGTAGKGSKSSLNAKNSLFGKILVMLEQHGKLAGKGAGKSHALLLGKDGKQAMLSGKGESLIASKSKHLLALVAKGKHHVKSEKGDQVTTLLAAHAFIDAAIQSKKSDQSGKTIVALQSTSVKGEQSAMAGKVLIQTSAFDVSDISGKHAVETGKSDKIARALLDEAKLSGTESNTDLLTSAKSASSKSLHGIDQAMSAEQKITQGIAHQTQNTEFAASAKLQTTEKAQFMAGKENAAISKHLAAAEGGQKMTATQLIGERIATATGQNSQAAIEKTAMRANAESANALAGAHLQQNKAVQLQHVQSASTSSAVTAAGIAISGVSDASLADTGSQTSDKGNQDGRFITALSGDAKATNTSAASSASFHQYLSGKATPSMTLFDTMNHIAQSASKGKTRLDIQLEPANLGKIQISLQSDAAKQLQVHIIVDQGTTRAALEQQLPQLKSALAQQGFDLSGFSMGSQGQQQTFSGHHSRGQAQHIANTAANSNEAETVNRQASTASGLSIRV